MAHEVSEFYIESPEPVKIYEALRNPSKCESASYTLSIHRTREGAEKAIKDHRDKEKAEHDNWNKEMGRIGYPVERFPFDFNLSWGVRETILLD